MGGPIGASPWNGHNPAVQAQVQQQQQQQANWAQTWPAASLNPGSDPVFDPSNDPVFDPSGDASFPDMKFNPEEDPVFLANGNYGMNPTFSSCPTSPFSSGLSGIPAAGGLQAELLNGSQLIGDPWNAPSGMLDVQMAPSTNGAGTIGSRSWQCDKCHTKNHLGATRCATCMWDRKAALKLRMRQDLMAKMVSNGGIPGHGSVGYPNGHAMNGSSALLQNGMPNGAADISSLPPVV